MVAANAIFVFAIRGGGKGQRGEKGKEEKGRVELRTATCPLATVTHTTRGSGVR